tara:strand:- start:480 stop:1118 length:639 start_codon:yes stop_codon:yes gene_type:complete
MPSIEIYPTIDGRVHASSGTWDGVRDATTGTAYTSDASDTQTPQAGNILGTRFISRGFFTFAIPSSVGTITAVTIRLTRKGNTPDGYFIASAKADATAIVDADFNNIDFSTAYSSEVDINGEETTTLNAAGISAVQTAVGGYFEFAYVENNYDYPDTDPGSSNSFGGIYFSEESGTDNDPMLTITYTAAEPDNNIKILAGTVHIGSNATIHI